jgi:hypothetical protein
MNCHSGLSGIFLLRQKFASGSFAALKKDSGRAGMTVLKDCALKNLFKTAQIQTFLIISPLFKTLCFKNSDFYVFLKDSEK